MIGALGAGLRWLTDRLIAGPDRWPVAHLWIGLALAALSALPVFLITKSLTEKAEHSQFVVSAERAAHRLALEVDLTLAYLRALKGLYMGSVHVSRGEFSSFVQALRPGEAVQALEWIPRVQATARAEFEDAAREDGFPDFQFRQYNREGVLIPAEERSEYFPVYYLEPHTGNEAAFGLDLGSNQARLDALHRARDSGNQSLSGRVRLAQEQEDQYGILVVDPVYAEAALDLDARVERLEGFALGVFRVADLIRLAIPENLFQVAVFDLSASPDERLLYPASEAVDASMFQHAVLLKIADRAWSVRLGPTATSEFSTLPWLAVATWLGVLLALWTGWELVSSRRHSAQLGDVNRRLEALSDERQQAIEELERSNRELDDFAYIASHDLKEPLRAIYNHASFLIEDYEDRLEQDGKKRLRRLIVLSRRMEQLIADLLYFSRLGRGKQAIAPLDPNVVIGDIEISHAEALRTRNARIVIAGPLPTIEAHGPHITALFQNLICNAIKYNDSEEKTVEIGVVPVDRPTPSDIFHTFYVRDNGIGIDEQFKQEVFRIFKRLNGGNAYAEGTGAGLSFAKKIVEGEGGRIWLTSKVGEGTTFFFTLRGAGHEIAMEADRRAA